MKIRLTPSIAMLLETIATETQGLEFSGFGFGVLNQEDKELLVYDFLLMDVGSSTLTEISAETVRALLEHPDREHMKVWVHLHPVGNGKPGFHNWSQTDEGTIRTTPLGGIPELVRWSASMVRTPKGWVGRIDNHLRGSTLHCPVVPQVDRGIYDQVEKLRWEYLTAKAAEHGIQWDEDTQAFMQAGDFAFDQMYFDEDWRVGFYNAVEVIGGGDPEEAVEENGYEIFPSRQPGLKLWQDPFEDTSDEAFDIDSGTLADSE
jgi:hypothetical protein